MKITTFKGRTLEAGDRVFVYKNLHNGKFSIKNLKTGLVVGHADRLSLTDVTFQVSTAGRIRVLKQQVKNVHAGVIGTYSPNAEFDLNPETRLVTYNPYYNGFFYDTVTKDPVDKASEVYFAASGRVYYNE